MIGTGDVAQDAIRAELASVRERMRRERHEQNMYLIQACGSTALLKQLANKEDRLLSFLAANGWLTDEDTKPELTEETC